MSEFAASSIGESLRGAREAQGLSVEEAARRLRLMHRQIEAMEREDFDSLGQPVFARGFVRNYARLLGLDPEVLLTRMADVPAAEPASVARASLPLVARRPVPLWLLLLLVGGLFVIVAPLALYWWLNSEVDAPAPAPPTVQTPASHAVAVPPPVAAPVEAVPAPAAEPAVETPTAAPADGVEAPPALGRLQFEFGDSSWVEVRDADGRMIMRQLNTAGSRAEVEGTPPFQLVVGNARQVRLSYNDRPIDLTPFIDVTVARFTLEN